MEKQERKSLLDTCVKHLNYERQDLATYDGRQRRDRQPLFAPVSFSRYTRTEALGRPLIPHLWYEGELACLFGEPNVGKTTLARQIMLEITENTQHSVIYFDLENNRHHVANAYSSDNRWIYKEYCDRGYFYTINDFCPAERYTPKNIMDEIEEKLANAEATVIIIDDISHICSIKSDERSKRVMQTLKQWTIRFKVSILVIAHSRYRQPDSLVSIRQLGTNPEFAYVFDSIFAIERTNFYRSKRVSHYIKQVKSRMEPITYTDTNVLPLSMRMIDTLWLGFRVVENETRNEHEYLRAADPFLTEEQIADAVVQHAALYHSVRYTANALHIPKSRVQRIIDRNRDRILAKIREQAAARLTEADPEPMEHISVEVLECHPDPSTRSYYFSRDEDSQSFDAPKLAPVRILTVDRDPLPPVQAPEDHSRDDFWQPILVPDLLARDEAERAGDLETAAALTARIQSLITQHSPTTTVPPDNATTVPPTDANDNIATCRGDACVARVPAPAADNAPTVPPDNATTVPHAPCRGDACVARVPAHESSDYSEFPTATRRHRRRNGGHF